MKELYDLLEEIKHQPLKYLGRTSVVALKGFINGYDLARREMGIPLTEQEKDFQEFQTWINPPDKPFFYSKDDSWDKILILFAGDENRAFRYFFSRLEQFKNRSPLEKPSEIEIEQARAERKRIRAEWQKSQNA